eukprot:10829442-Karenia_brevis.AAC.1
MMTVRKRAVARRLRRLLGQVIRRGASGTLPRECRWILGSTLVFLEKPGKSAPRPIRSGEYFRKIVAKALIRDNKKQIQQLM